MKAKLIAIATLGILIMGSILVSAEERNSIVVEESDATLLEKLGNYLRFEYKIFQSFSVVGDNRDCGDRNQQPHETIYIDYEDEEEIDVDDYCDSGYGLINVFSDWDPLAEFRENVDVFCFEEDGCQAEVYCCPYSEPDDDEDCQDEGFPEGSYHFVECDERDGSYDMKIGRTETLWWCPGESEIPYEDDEYAYCQCENERTCWYYDNGNCDNTRTYCDVDDCEDLTYMSMQLYNSKSTCEGDNEEEEEECLGDADTNCDGEVNLNEMMAYAQKWIDGEVSREELGEAIMYWIAS